MRPEIGGRPIGGAAPVFAIAEIGLNHGGSAARALAMVDAAASAGASAVKLQSLEADRLVAAHCGPPAHVAATSLREFFKAFELDWEGHRAVVARAHAHGLAAITTPFFEAALPILSALGFDAFKIASGDLTYDGLVTAAAATGKPLVISTGMGDLAEVRHALSLARDAGAAHVSLLHCVSAYPTPLQDENLRAIATLAEACGVPVGLSDHGRGLSSAIAAVALGARVYERHFVLDGDDAAIDRAVSSTPAEFAAIVAAMHETLAALGDGIKSCRPSERPNRAPSRRGLYAARTLAPGEVVTAGDIAVLRPVSALNPADAGCLAGTRLARGLAAGEAFRAADLAAAAVGDVA